MRILVVGASGLVGSHVYFEAKQRGWEVLGTYRSHPVESLTRLDLGDLGATRRLLEDFRPDCVIHAAGWTWVDGCEKDQDRAYRENCEQPEMLARLCREQGCRFVYFSTTYVFDGKHGPYDEKATPNPINVYAKSKWMAEQRVQTVMEGQALIPRVICVWGREAQGKNFVYQVIKALREDRPLTLPSDQVGNPTWAGDIAWWLLELIDEGERGIWNLAGDLENCTRVEWFCAIRDAARSVGLVPQGTAAGYIERSTEQLAQSALRPLHAGAHIAKVLTRFPRRLAAPTELANLRFDNLHFGTA